MSQWQNVQFAIPRQPDPALIAAVVRSFAEAEIDLGNLSFTPIVGGPAITCPAAQLDSQTELADLLAENTILIRSFSFPFSSGQPILSISRNDKALRDQVTLGLTALDNQPKAATREQVNRLVPLLKKNLKEITEQSQLEALGPAVREHLEVRGANLAQLESALQKILVEFGQSAAKQRADLETEFSNRRRELDDSTREEREKIDGIHQTRTTSLEEKEEALKKRLAEVDDRASRHARREIRSDIKKELAKRYEKFELTEGTQKLRSPIFYFSIVLLVAFGGGFAFYAYESFVQMSGSAVATAQTIAMAVRQTALALAFGSTAVFFIRWNNRWFEQHAAEEFKLKRLELDLDRATWVVEMALEWKDEKGTEIPAELIDRLTANLFADPDERDLTLHPADQLASALLGTSAEATVNLPGGGSIKLDRKSMRELSKRKFAE